MFNNSSDFPITTTYFWFKFEHTISMTKRKVFFTVKNTVSVIEMEECNISGNGTIDFSEFLAMMASQMRSVDEEAEFREAFKGRY